MLRNQAMKALYNGVVQKQLNGMPVMRGTGKDARPMNNEEINGLLFTLNLVREIDGYSIDNSLFGDHVASKKKVKPAKNKVKVSSKDKKKLKVKKHREDVEE